MSPLLLGARRQAERVGARARLGERVGADRARDVSRGRYFDFCASLPYVVIGIVDERVLHVDR